MKHQIRMAVDRVIRTVAARTRIGALPTNFNGTWLMLPTTDWPSIYHRYEPYQARLFRQHLRAGDSVIDVGAHCGWWSAFAAELVGPRGTVLACEPSVAYDRLTALVRRYPQIIPVRHAVGAATATTTFFAQGDGTSGSLARDVTKLNEGWMPATPISEIPVSVRSLDDLVDAHRLAPRLIKVDVEGFEGDVLKGAQRLLAAGNTAWVIEIHPPHLKVMGRCPDDILRLLTEAGYQHRIVHRAVNSIFTIYAPPPGSP